MKEQIDRLEFPALGMLWVAEGVEHDCEPAHRFRGKVGRCFVWFNGRVGLMADLDEVPLEKPLWVSKLLLEIVGVSLRRAAGKSIHNTAKYYHDERTVK